MDGIFAQTFGQAIYKFCHEGATREEGAIAIVIARRLVRLEFQSTSHGRWERLDDVFRLLTEALLHPDWEFWEVRALLGVSDLFRCVPQDRCVCTGGTLARAVPVYRLNDV